MDIRAYKPYTLVGPTVTIPVLTPSGTDTSTTDYIYLSDWKFPPVPRANATKSFSVSHSISRQDKLC